jgi:DNA-binding XRE family transcriptional regulator
MPTKPKSKKEASERSRIASQFREFRLQAKMTQAELGRSMGVSRDTVQLIEAQKVMPHFRTQIKFQDLVKKHTENA